MGLPPMFLGGRVHGDVPERPPVKGAPVPYVVILVPLDPLEFHLAWQCLDPFSAVQGKVVVEHVGVQCAWVAEAFDAPFAIETKSDFTFCDAVLGTNRV